MLGALCPVAENWWLETWSGSSIDEGEAKGQVYYIFIYAVILKALTIDSRITYHLCIVFPRHGYIVTLAGGVLFLVAIIFLGFVYFDVAKLLEICGAWTPWHGLPFIQSMVKPLPERLSFELSVHHESFCKTCFAALIRIQTRTIGNGVSLPTRFDTLSVTIVGVAGLIRPSQLHSLDLVFHLLEA
ncbi:hypothetical protein EV702DRAFT_1193367 [Suillus placidus]|uniref:Uncharacterized protein n=1 Tax=Suillus placidus TaxID=48579 RepID=A0A9P7D6U9_9AGAM|nr:hypothetical protein EV702DRAFT_1193367 [Suillus placidus]